MIRKLILALALLAPSLAVAQTLPQAGVYKDPSGTVQAAIGTFCVPAKDGTGCSGGVVGGGGDASAANQTTQITAEQAIRDEIGAISASPTVNTLQGRLAALLLAQNAGNTSLSTLAGTVAAIGATAPTTAQQVAGVTPAGTTRALSLGALGGLAPVQAAPTSTRTTMTASTATPIEAAGVAARVAESIFAESSLTANVYVCSTQTTACSATNYDFLIPNGAAAGTIYTPIFGTTGRLYAYTTGTPVLVLNSWVAQ